MCHAKISLGFLSSSCYPRLSAARSGARVHWLKKQKKKIYGLILCVGGAMVVVLGSNHHKRHHAVTTSSGTKSRIPKDAAAKTYPILGTALILFEVLGVALFYVILPVLSRFYKSAWLTSMVILSSLPVYILTFFSF